MLRQGVHLREVDNVTASCPPNRMDGESTVEMFVENVIHSNNRVQVLRYSDGAHVRAIGSEGSGNGQFNRLWGGIAIDSDGCIVVADTGNHRVQVLE